MRTPRRPLTACPVCGGDLVTTRLGCHDCGTELVGEFGSCSFCALDDADLELLRVFLVSRGNLRELEKHLGVSYPTARARYADLLAKLGLQPAGEESGDDAADATDGAEAADAADAPGAPETGDHPASGGSEPPAGVRDQVLAQVASGALAPDVAADLLRRLG